MLYLYRFLCFNKNNKHSFFCTIWDYVHTYIILYSTIFPMAIRNALDIGIVWSLMDNKLTGTAHKWAPTPVGWYQCQDNCWGESAVPNIGWHRVAERTEQRQKRAIWCPHKCTRKRNRKRKRQRQRQRQRCDAGCDDLWNGLKFASLCQQTSSRSSSIANSRQPTAGRRQKAAGSLGYWVVDCPNERLNADKLLVVRTFSPAAKDILPARQLSPTHLSHSIPIPTAAPAPSALRQPFVFLFPDAVVRNRWFVMVLRLYIHMNIFLCFYLRAAWLMLFDKLANKTKAYLKEENRESI